MSLHVKNQEHALYARCGSSDLDVFEQVFVREEYRSLKDAGEVSLIVDCGAYVGYSASYFLNTFPGQRAFVARVFPEANHPLHRVDRPFRVQDNFLAGRVGLGPTERPHRKADGSGPNSLSLSGEAGTPDQMLLCKHPRRQLLHSCEKLLRENDHIGAPGGRPDRADPHPPTCPISPRRKDCH
jgi:hypothetical protein